MIYVIILQKDELSEIHFDFSKISSFIKIQNFIIFKMPVTLKRVMLYLEEPPLLWRKNKKIKFIDNWMKIKEYMIKAVMQE